MVELPDIQWGINWREMAEKSGQKFIPLIQRHQYCAYHNLGNGAFYHRKERIRLLWPSYEWHRWNERRLKADCDYDWLTNLGPACLSGETNIFNPLTGQSTTIQQLYRKNEQPVVLTLYGSEKASVPFVRGYGTLYKVSLSNGESFKAYATHRVLTSRGYSRVDHICIGDSLASFSLSDNPSFRRAPSLSYASHLGSSSESALLVRAEDAHYFPKKAASCPVNCSTDFCLDDARPRSVIDSDRSFFPLPIDAQEHTACACVDSDGLEHRPLYIQPYLSEHHLSSSMSFHRHERLGEECSEGSALRMLRRDACAFLCDEQSTTLNRQIPIDPRSDRDLQDTHYFLDNCGRRLLDSSFKVQHNAVVAICKSEPELFYDLTVPNAGHYYAEGAIHHNSAAKSTDFAVFGLEYWLQAPDRTAIIICSTTAKMLRLRIWSQVAHYHQALPKNLGSIGDLLDSATRIRWKAGDDKNGIFGMAVEEGPIEAVVNDLVGIHTERVVLILDEMQGVREAIMRATNNMVANPVFRFRGMGNPDSLTNPLGRESEPIDGWDSVARGETEQWETHGGPTKGRGLCQFFDGRKSPADDSPEEKKRLRWLCNREWYEGILKAAHGNENDPSVWQFGIGWPPPMGLESTLLDDAIAVTFHCRDKAVWTHGFRKGASLDPAFGGGDKRKLTFFNWGETQDDNGRMRWVIESKEVLNVPIDAESTRPIHYQIVDFCKVECQKRGIGSFQFSLDSSGEGGGLKSIFEEQWGPVNGIEAGGLPSDLPVSDALNVDGTPKTARESYDTRASELCFSVREFALANGIRGMSNDQVFQACNRRTFYRNGKWCTEPKVGSKGRTDEKGRPVKGYKSRMGHSPDDFDSFAIGVEYCRQNGAVASSEIKISERPLPQPDGYDEWSEQNYLKGYSFV